MTEQPKKRGRPRKAKPSLDPGQVAFVRGLTEGKTLAAAYKDALGAGLSPRNGGWQALRTIKLKVPEIMDALGLTQEHLIEKHLKPMLEATETKVFKANGIVLDTDEEGNKTMGDGGLIYSEPLVAWGPRKDALDISFRLHGSYARPADTEAQVQVLNKITVVIEDVAQEGKVIEQTN